MARTNGSKPTIAPMQVEIAHPTIAGADAPAAPTRPGRDPKDIENDQLRREVARLTELLTSTMIEAHTLKARIDLLHSDSMTLGKTAARYLMDAEAEARAERA